MPPSDPPPAAAVAPGRRVRHPRFGMGRVELDKGRTTLARFDHGYEECETSELSPVAGVLEAAGRPQWDVPLEVLTRVQAEAIRSVNDAWGVFSRSRIALLPHQLWVCRQVLAEWPTRWLVADDVGLGKTVEAGLILWPLLARGRVRRLLVLCPASLVEQWQYRMLSMFDIRLTQYAPEMDTPRSGFWGTQNQVVASVETLRLDHRGRQDRLFESPPWDLLVVDEAHRLNYDEEAGPTLGYQLVGQLLEEKRVESAVFFTGTPHRGKDFGFLALLRLLRPDLFDPRRPMREQLPLLRRAMIRNNKQNVTDLKGDRLFHAPVVQPQTYSYTPAEQHFYDTLTEFIVSGKAYASSLGARSGRAVMLVLISMQKLASSSVAAIRHALQNRLAKIRQARQDVGQLHELRDRLAEYESLEQAGGDVGDRLAALEEDIAERSAQLKLMEDEEQRLQELVAAADGVTAETKVDAILRLLRGPFRDRPVLLFTEYKATQSLLMSALVREFGDGCVTFINGDERAEGVADATGRPRVLTVRREAAAAAFNAGDARFLVSTEAGGEGIDLQENCHSLIHVDLPWNPMRLHQRVGRLNRYGQAKQVEVFTVRNPDTVESRIWEKLDAKTDSIMQALGRVMDEPEDLKQLVLGMTSPSLFTELFAEAPAVAAAALPNWFDRKTTTFGGRDVIEAVRDLVGNCARFDYKQTSAVLPRLDLPALRPFLVGALTLHRRKVREDDSGRLSFKTPDDWARLRGIEAEYEGMIFDREDRSKDAARRLLGVGHRLVDHVLHVAAGSEACAASLPAGCVPRPLFVFRVRDRLTAQSGNIRSLIVAAEYSAGPHDHNAATQGFRAIKDWELIEQLNSINPLRPKLNEASPRPADAAEIASAAAGAEAFIVSHINSTDTGFRVPVAELLAILWPWDSASPPGEVADTAPAPAGA
jgi:superfamily II DNA or RNA helicase